MSIGSTELRGAEREMRRLERILMYLEEADRLKSVERRHAESPAFDPAVAELLERLLARAATLMDG